MTTPRAMRCSMTVAVARAVNTAQMAMTTRSMAHRYLRSRVSKDVPATAKATVRPPASRQIPFESRQLAGASGAVGLPIWQRRAGRLRRGLVGLGGGGDGGCGGG